MTTTLASEKHTIASSQASLEEKALTDLFPAEYEEYAKRVPRMVPSLASGALDTILNGLKSKKEDAA